MLTTRTILTFLLTAYAAVPIALGEEQDITVGEAMSRCLSSYNWSSWHVWRFDVYAAAQEKVLIGNVENYYRFTVDRPGFEHLINGKVVHQDNTIESIAQLASQCTADTCPHNIDKRISWFKRRCKAFE